MIVLIEVDVSGKSDHQENGHEQKDADNGKPTFAVPRYLFVCCINVGGILWFGLSRPTLRAVGGACMNLMGAVGAGNEGRHDELSPK